MQAGSGGYLWVKAFHIVFVSAWFAALFYLPRIYVNLAQVGADSAAERTRLVQMARRLYRFGLVLMVPALGLGFVLWLVYGIGRGPGQGWLHAKLALVAAVLGYQWWCGQHLRRLADGSDAHTHTWFRVFNEISVLAFAAIVVLVVVKPF